ncbi:TPA: hypothetical protein NGR52_004240 [Vibrio parahaemolyticus]|nr:hypothetical protein [Vibrio parahaemolyticus]
MAMKTLNDADFGELLTALAERWNSEVNYTEELEHTVDELQERSEAQAIKLMERIPNSSGDIEQQLKNALADLDDANKKLRELTQKADLNENKLIAANSKVNNLEHQLTNVRGELSRFRAKNDELVKEKVELETRITKYRANEHFLEGQITSLKQQLQDAQEAQSEAQEGQAEVSKLKGALNKADKQLTELRRELNTANQKLSNFDGVDLKALNTKVNNLKARNGELLAAKELLIKENRAYRVERDTATKQLINRNQQIELNEERIAMFEELVERYKYREKISYSRAIYLSGETIIALLPQRFKVNVDGVQGAVEQHHLLYSNRRGIWKQVSLDPNGELSVARPYFDGVNSKTEAAMQKVLPNPSNDEAKFMHDWLCQVRENEWQVTDLDVLSLQEGRMLSLDEAYEKSIEDLGGRKPDINKAIA